MGEKEDLAIIDRIWTDEQRRTVWCLICKSRKGLNVEISPIIASAFVILQKYFRSQEDCSYELFILMTAALFAACKAADSYRPMQAIYQELSQICQQAPSIKIRKILGDRADNPIINTQDLIQISNAEIDLLRSIDFNTEIDTPFIHFEKWKQNLMVAIPDESIIRLCNAVIVDICLMLCSAFYLDVPPEVAAAAATADTLGERSSVISIEALEWFRQVKEKYGPEVFALACDSIHAEKQKTAFRRPS